MKHKTAELTGALLDAAVAKALGIPLVKRGNHIITDTYDENHLAEPMRYSAYWERGGPILERERIALSEKDGVWQAHCRYAIEDPPERLATMYGPTPLIAAMRAYVASKLGDEVELP